LIERCETRLRRHGEGESRALFPRQTRPAAEMLDDYATWRARWPQATQQEIADEMGVTRSALRRALDRDRAQARAETEKTEETTMSWFQDAKYQAAQALDKWTAPLRPEHDSLSNWSIETTRDRQAEREWSDPEEAVAAERTEVFGYDSGGPKAYDDAWPEVPPLEISDEEVAALNQEQARDYAERGPDITDYWTTEEEDNWANFRETPSWALYPDEYRGHEYNQAKDVWSGRSPTAEDVAEAEEEAHSYDEQGRSPFDRERELQEDIDVGAVPVKYADDGVWIGEEFYSHDSLLSDEPDRGADWVREDEDAPTDDHTRGCC
jgi:predicted transcriptional regulator